MEVKKYKLGDLCKENEIGIYGIPATAEEFSEHKIRYLRITDISDDGILLDNDKKSVSDKNIEKYFLHEGDIVFARTGNSTGRAYLYNVKDGILAFAGFLIKYGLDKNKVNPQFLRFYTISNIYKQWVKNLSVGSTRGNISAQTFAECPITLPERKQQDLTVAVLSLFDDKIYLNKHINTKLEQMTKRLYDYWFVQFDFPNAEGKPYKASGGKMVYNETLKREIPEGWQVKKISDLLECDISGDWGEEEIKGKHKYKVNCIRGCDMVDMTNLPVRYILESNSKKLLQKDDFVIEISGGSPTQSTGRIVQITDEIIKRFNGKVICSNFCHGVRINDKDYVSYFLQMWNMFYDNNIFFNYEGKTSGLKNFQFDTFVSESWYFPPKELVRKYHEVVSEFIKQIDKNESETQKLTSLRDRLLPLLMNGQVETK